MSTYLVTGGAGFIGSSITEELLRLGETVRVLDDFSSGHRKNLEGLAGKLDVLEGTIADPVTVKRALDGVEVVFHQAAIPSVMRSVENPKATVIANVEGTTVLLDEARHTKVRRVVFAGSSSVYGDTPTLPKIETMAPQPLSPYAVSKLAGEHLMRVYAGLYNLETVTLRYFNVFGPRQDPKSQYAAAIPNFLTAGLTGTRPRVYGDGEQTRDFCFIDNVVHANLVAANTSSRLGGQVINIACGDRITVNLLLKCIGDELGVRLDPEYVPSRPGDVRDSLADISAARRLIGYEPMVTVREGLKRTVLAFRQIHGSDATIPEGRTVRRVATHPGKAPRLQGMPTD
jgi:nucleoside-diphosphate-sugar epimerase